MTHLDNCAISATFPPDHTSLPEGNGVVCSDCNYSVGIKVWFLAIWSDYWSVWGHSWDNKAAALVPCLPVTSIRARQTHGLLTAVGEYYWRLLCWLMVTEMSDNNRADSSVTLLTKQSEDQSPETWRWVHMKGPFRYQKEKGRQAARMILKFFLSHRIKLIVSWALSHRINASADLTLTVPLIWAALNNSVTIWHKCAFKCKS